MERIIVECINNKDISTVEGYDKSFGEMLDTLDDYWGNCEYSIIDLGNGKVSLAYMVGGLTT